MAPKVLAAAGMLAMAWGGGAILVPREMAVSFLEAFVSESGKPFLAECVAEAGDAKQDLQDVIGDVKEALEEKNLEDVSMALRDLADFLDEAPEALTYCKKGAASARETARAFRELIREGPLKTMWQHAVGDHARITSELDASFVAYSTKNYTASGDQLGKAFRHMVVAKHNLTAFGDTTKLAAVVAFVNGFLAWDDGSQFGMCLLPLFQGGKISVAAAERLLKGMYHRNLTEMRDALNTIWPLVKNLKPFVHQNCGQFKRRVRETANALEELRTEAHMAVAVQEHLLADHKNITGELNLALARSGAEDTMGTGEHLGKLLRLLLVGEPSAALAPVMVV